MSVVLTEHLPLLATAPDGIQKLRGLILELAVRGKLVPQDPNDEPASELLKQIAQERARLEGDGICKKSKSMPPVGEKEQSFQLPHGWEWTRLGVVQVFTNGYAFPSLEFSTSGVGVIRISDVWHGEVLLSKIARFPAEKANALDTKYRVEPGDLVMTMTGSVKLGFNNTGETLLLNQRVGKISPIIVSPKYLYRLLVTTAEERIAAASGSVIANVSTEEINATVLPLPPLAEQHRIVAKVDELMTLCDRLEAGQADAESAHAKLVDTLLGTLTQSTDAADLTAKWQRLAEHFDTLFTTESSLDALKQTILQLAVMGKLALADANDESVSALLEHVATTKSSGCGTKLGRDWVDGDDQPIDAAFQIPPNWHWVRITEVVERVTVGYVGSMKSQYVDQGIPFLRSQNVRPNKFREDGLVRISPEFHRSIAKSALCPGDVVVVRSGAVGTACVIPPSLADANCSDLVVIKKPIGVLPDFLCFYLNSLAAKHISEGTVGIALTHFNTKSVALMPLPLPPFPEQHRIVAKVDELMALCDRLKADLAESRRRQERLASTLIESALNAA